MQQPILTLPRIITLSILLRLILFLYGLYQDAHSALKYTDVDYYVFTDASRFVARSLSPYERETYRYTPLLAWILLPCSYWFSFGKALFAIGDVLAGCIILHLLVRHQQMDQQRALLYTAVTWLLNPMVATISTRGSSEGLLGLLVSLLLWATLSQNAALSGILLGLSTHLKVYPIIYGPSILLHFLPYSSTSLPALVKSALTKRPLIFVVTAVGSFAFLNAGMYVIYGKEFIQHTFTHHITRLDHRHNFSAWNTLLHFSPFLEQSSVPFSLLAFLPQLLLSFISIPLSVARLSLPQCLFLQTFAFVTFNKVVTSQYFIWYLFLLPFILPGSSLVKSPTKGILGLLGWVGTQALWLGSAYQLEFLGLSTFFPSLWAAGLAFFAVNAWLLGEFVSDARSNAAATTKTGSNMERKVI